MFKVPITWYILFHYIAFYLLFNECQILIWWMVNTFIKQILLRTCLHISLLALILRSKFIDSLLLNNSFTIYVLVHTKSYKQQSHEVYNKDQRTEIVSSAFTFNFTLDDLLLQGAIWYWRLCFWKDLNFHTPAQGADITIT